MTQKRLFSLIMSVSQCYLNHQGDVQILRDGIVGHFLSPPCGSNFQLNMVWLLRSLKIDVRGF